MEMGTPKMSVYSPLHLDRGPWLEEGQGLQQQLFPRVLTIGSSSWSCFPNPHTLILGFPAPHSLLLDWPRRLPPPPHHTSCMFFFQ